VGTAAMPPSRRICAACFSRRGCGFWGWTSKICDTSALSVLRAGRRLAQATATGILPIFACHSFGPVLCTLVPSLSTATVTGMSLTSNS